MFYGTNRDVVGEGTRPPYYGTGRAEVLSFGTCEVALPPSHEIGGRRRWFGLRSAAPFALQSVKPKERQTFLSFFRSRLEASPARDIFVYVHGYNNSFEEACARAAQLMVDTKFPGQVAIWSWPSLTNLRSYISDAAQVAVSTPSFEDFLVAIKREGGARFVHVIAHSMGSLLVANALAALGRTSGTEQLVAEVVLLAPEIDVDLIRVHGDWIHRVADRLTVYVDSSDLALRLAALINGFPRAGQGAERLRGLEWVNVIDAAPVYGGIGGLISTRHTYYFETRPILTDISDLIRLRTPPDQRSNLREQTRDGFTYWQIAR